MADDSSDRVAMWQTYVQSAENTSNRREAVNRYMVFTHLAVYSAHFALPGQMTPFVHVCISGAGVVVAALWIVLLYSHGKINEVKYDIIRALEANLPCQPFEEEAKRTGIDTRRIYPPLAMAQNQVAAFVGAAHLTVLIYNSVRLICNS